MRNENKNRWKGKEFWRTLNLVIFFIIYAVLFIIPILFPEYLLGIGIGIVFIILLYATIQQYVYRKMENKNAGIRVLYGWIDEEPGLGEEYEIIIKKIKSFEKLPRDEQKNIKDIEEQMRIVAIEENEEDVKKGLDRFLLPQFEQTEQEKEYDSGDIENMEDDLDEPI